MAAETLSDRLLDAFVSSGTITGEQLATATSTARDSGRSVGRVLVDRGLVSPNDVVKVLERELGVPQVELSSYAPEDEALDLVPADFAREHRMLPLFDIEGVLTVAVGDPVDVFELEHVERDLGLRVEPVLAEQASLLEAIVQSYGAAPESGAPADDDDAPAQELGAVAATPAEADASAGTPVAPGPAEAPIDVEEPRGADTSEVAAADSVEAVVTAEAENTGGIDLDVLAVADAGKVAVLVSDILEDAVRRGASRIHLLPYKNDFFLVYRVKGRLERVASAPLSLQGALVAGFKNFARLEGVPASLPALGRVRARYADRDLVLTVSAVPTISGQRVVITLRPHEPVPPDLASLGMSEAEVRALHAMVERGRGMLLVCAPVAEGRSATYYALLSHAAQVGKTVYSVEESVGYEIPAVSQVMVNPGSPVGPSSYLAAGLRQDTDVIAIDSATAVDEVHLAVEAAGKGKLVVVTFTGGGVVEGVSRMLGLGVEPHSLASALTMAVGQRIVRTNCPNCAADVRSGINAAIPGLEDGEVTRAGSGCPNCRDTGFGGATGIFEVLPFTSNVRMAVSRGASKEGVEEAAMSAGMRPLVRSGVTKVQAGEVSAEELDRVLGLSG